MIRVVADDRIPFLRGALEGVAEVKYLPGAGISRGDLMGADALITRTRTLCNRALLEGTGVKFIASATIGYDHIDAAFCRSEGIGWSNAPGCNADSVQQYMVSALFSLAEKRSLDLESLTIGIIGVGNVGSRVSDAAGNLGMRVLLNDPPRQEREGPEGFVDLQDLMDRADIISLHVPLNRGGPYNTFRMVDHAFIHSLKRGAILINTSRGSIVNESDLLDGILEDHLSAVVLDVFDNEPGINLDLLNAITLGTPHIAGYSLDGKANGTAMSVRAISRFFKLGMDAWEPEDIPMPREHQLYADASRGNPQELIREIYRRTYDVDSDDGRLRNDPGAFEKLRGDYPLRREPGAYTVRLFQGYQELVNRLEGLGFPVLADHCV